MLYVLRGRVLRRFDREDQPVFATKNAKCIAWLDVMSPSARECSHSRLRVSALGSARTHPTGKSILSLSLSLSFHIHPSFSLSRLQQLPQPITHYRLPTSTFALLHFLSFNSRLDFVSLSILLCLDRRISTRAEQPQMNLSKPSPYSASDAPGLLYASFNQG